VDGFRVASSDLLEGYLGGYYPECNPLIPLSHHVKESKVSAANSTPVRIARERHVKLA